MGRRRTVASAPVDDVQQANCAGGEMMYTNPAYSTVGDEGVVTFESKPKL